ncbi:hypothetical protein [Streptomyces sp. NPDC055299]
MGTPATPDRSRLRVLVIEDDDTIGRHLQTGLRCNGYAPTWSRTGASGLAEAARTPYDALLLDLGLPDNGRPRRGPHPAHPLPRPAHHHPHRPHRRHRRLVKPFSLTVLLARLRAHLRRHTITPTPQEVLQLGDLTVDTTERHCTAPSTAKGANCAAKSSTTRRPASCSPHMRCWPSRSRTPWPPRPDPQAPGCGPPPPC